MIATIAASVAADRVGCTTSRTKLGSRVDRPPAPRHSPSAVQNVKPSGSRALTTSATNTAQAESVTLGVTDSAWAVFVADVVSARLPDGFTFWTAEGEWRGAGGRSTREPSFVLEVVHPTRSAATEAAIVAIIAEYKRRFRQESVLRVVSSGRASY